MRVFCAMAFFILLLQNLDYQGMISDITSQLQESVNIIHSLQEETLQLKSFIADSNFKSFEIVDVEVTGYAPLDPNAKKGMCYSGDPNITASGRRVEPDITVAASPEIPFGSWIWLEELGWRRVDDRGGKIKGDRIDVCFSTRQEAIDWGRRKIAMVIPHREGE